MTLPPNFATVLLDTLAGAPKTPIPVGRSLLPNAQAWLPRDSIMASLIGAAADLQAQISGAPASNAPLRRLYVTKNPDDPFGGNIQAAVNACESPSASAPWVVEVLSPGEYAGPVVLPEHVYLVASVPWGTAAVTLRSSGNTLTLPEVNSGLTGLTVGSDSTNPAHAAVTVIPGAGPGEQSMIVNARAVAANAAASLRVQPGCTSQFVVAVADLNGNSSGPLVDVQGGGVVAVFAGMTNFGTGDAMRATGGSFSLVFNAVIQNNSGAAGWLVDADGATVILFTANTLISANGYRGRNGALVALVDAFFFGPPAGTLIDMDATSILGLSEIDIAGGGSPYAQMTIANPANVLHSSSLGFMTGTSAAPDQRPTAPQPGMRFYATNRAAGTRQLTFIPGTGWVDQTDTVVL